MKKAILALTIALASTAAFAQDKMDSKMEKMESMPKMKGNDTDRMEMKQGKMMVHKDGKMVVMTKNQTLPNGTVVMTNGKVKTKAGKMMQLKEGESVDKMGKLSTMEKVKTTKMKGKMESKM